MHDVENGDYPGKGATQLDKMAASAAAIAIATATLYEKIEKFDITTKF